MFNTTSSPPLTSAEIADLEIQVRRQLSRRIQGLCVLRKDGGLVLQGQVRSYYLRQLAQHSLMSSCDLSLLANEIEVVANKMAMGK